MSALQFVDAISPLLVGMPAALIGAVAMLRPGRWVKPLPRNRWDVRL